MNIRRFPFTLSALLAFLLLAGCAATEAESGPAADEPTAPVVQEPAPGVREPGLFTILGTDAKPLPDATLALYDAAGKELSRDTSDDEGNIRPSGAKEAVELRLSAPGHEERRIRLVPGLAARGGTLAYTAVKPGTPFTLHLPVISGTGYTWTPAPGQDIAVIGTEELREAKRLGGPAVQRLSLTAKSASGEAILLYARPWEKHALPAGWRVLLLEAE